MLYTRFIMEPSSLSPIQQEILKALQALGEKSKYPETLVAKKIRENNKIATKKKSVIALADIEKVLAFLEADGTAYYSLSLNSANDLLIEKTGESKPLSPEARQRRVKSERSLTIFTNKDVQ
jgi:hypothetical protein